MAKHYAIGKLYAPDVDSYIVSTAPTSNYGTSEQLIVGANSSKGGGDIFRALLRQNIWQRWPQLPQDATIDSAKIWFYVSSYSGLPSTINYTMRRVLRAWTETGVTWNKYDGTNDWTTAGCGSDGNDYTSTGAINFNGPSATGWFSLTITSLVQDAHASRSGSFNVIVVHNDAGSGVTWTFQGCDSLTRPCRLEINWSLANKAGAQVLVCG